MPEVISCTELPVADQFEAWLDAVSHTYVPLEAVPKARRAPFPGGIVSQDLGRTRLSQVSGGAADVRRTGRTISAGDPGLYKLGLQLRGHCVVRQDGREAELAPGDFAIYDTGRPYELAFDDTFNMLVVMFPRDLLRHRSRRVTELNATRISGRRGLGAVASSFLGSLGRGLTANTGTGDVRIADAVLDVLSATFDEDLDCAERPSHESHRRALLLRVQAFIDERLADPGLKVSTIAAAHHVSVRYLQKLFEDEGTTVTAWVRDRRLDKCRRDLLDPAQSARPISAVASQWGLVDAAHFSRLFKAAYGCSPRDYRFGVAEH